MDDYAVKDNGWKREALVYLTYPVLCGWVCENEDCGKYLTNICSGPPLRSQHHSSCKYYLAPVAVSNPR